MLLSCLAGGYHIDEQVNYPYNKHATVIPQRYKGYFFFKNKKTRHKYLKAALLIEIIGYIEFVLSLLSTLIFILIKSFPNNMVILLIVILGCDDLFAFIIYVSYKIKFK